MMRGRRGNKVSLVVIIIVLVLCIWLLYRLFIGLPPAPAPVVETAKAPSHPCPHHLSAFSINSLACASLSQ